MSRGRRAMLSRNGRRCWIRDGGGHEVMLGLSILHRDGLFRCVMYNRQWKQMALGTCDMGMVRSACQIPSNTIINTTSFNCIKINVYQIHKRNELSLSPLFSILPKLKSKCITSPPHHQYPMALEFLLESSTTQYALTVFSLPYPSIALSSTSSSSST
jgi:hypothetical protein